MAETVQSRNCGNPECDVSNTGICVEGNTPAESCPFFGQTTDDTLQEFENDELAESYDVQQSLEPIRHSLPSGDALTPTEVDQFLRWKPARFVTIVGDFNSGKTTLICALYDRFLRGSFAGHLFGGSRTLFGLEKKSHHSRIASGRAVPDTLRTSLSDGLKFFHFSLAPCDDLQSRIELMLSDRAGEQYLKARNNSDVVSELIELKNAQYVVLLMDGARIADPIQRAGAMQSVRQTLRAFLDGGALSEASRVQVVTTKIDLMENIPEKQTLDDQLYQFRARLEKDFVGRLGELSFWEVAARDPEGNYSAAYGVEHLLASWCAFTAVGMKRSPLQIALNTEFDRLLLRTPMGDLP